MKKTLLATAFVGLGLPTAAMADCGEVSIAEMNWASGQIITRITEFLMVQGYGCDVTVVPSATTTAITSLAENNEPDIVPELWVNSAPAYFDLEAEGKLVKASDVFAEGGSENWWVPDYLVAAHPELATIEGVLANPDLVGGRFHNCPDGWGCRIANDNLVKAFDFDGKGMEVFNHGSGETLAATMAAAYENQEPWFGYYWGPTAVLGRYNMVAVDMGPYDAEIHACNQTQDCAAPQISAYPAAPVLTVVTSDFAERNPDVFELVSNISFGTQELSNLLAWQKDNKASAEEATVHFLTTNQDTWKSWINEGAATKLGAIFK
ncbi:MULTISPECIES: ABC transporter substrate-binding protein [Nereida]|uniref:Glycine betaine transporter periplasmic subunit n=1 Tax=Nereida ignava TaxID=282199 RepID=A0A0U1NMD8_9RHOB|nr:ABC transporter substrate-binding protein [Nereida ignava]CRK75900.1 glycine betaine transporter periplasmic subunit [Nereida ignava]SFJ76468.1 glycine betaine/proline transport system substrate-binding protein [Nereida ignava DSM 16309]